MAASYNASKTILLSTFNKFNFNEEFGVETGDDEGKVYVKLLWCLVCKRHENVLKSVNRPKRCAGMYIV